MYICTFVYFYMMSRRNIFVTLPEPAAIVRRDQKALKREKEKLLSCRTHESTARDFPSSPNKGKI